MALFEPSARGDDALPFSVEAGACPSSELVEAQLAPLLDEKRRAALAETPSSAIRVADFGESYRIEVGAESRWVVDETRDCVERARVASVFIAMNLAEPVRAAAPAVDVLPPSLPSRAPSPNANTAPAKETPETSPASRLEVLAAAEYTISPAAGIGTFGARAGIAFRMPSWLFHATSGVQAPTELQLSSDRDMGGSVDLVRIPTALGVAWLGEWGSLELGPQVAMVTDLLVFRGHGLPNARAEVRVSPGASVGLVVRARLSRGSRVFSSVAGAAYPIDYRLRLDPARTLGHAPRLWLGVGLGGSWDAAL